MADTVADDSRKLTRTEASAAVTGLGWRYLLGILRCNVPVSSLGQALEAARRAAAAAGPDADECLSADLRPDSVILTLQSRSIAAVTARDARVARQVTESLHQAGHRTVPGIGDGAPRSVQITEIAIDALDIPAIRPFWQAALGYVSEPGLEGPTDGLVDPGGQGPAVWFQQMDEARPQRNRIHFDITVPHDEAERRMAAVRDAGGTLLDDKEAPAFWVFADAEGNEACICTWQARDQPG